MFRLLKKVIILIMSAPLTWGYCLFLTVRKAKLVLFHKTCKCGCLLDEKVCNNLQ